MKSFKEGPYKGLPFDHNRFADWLVKNQLKFKYAFLAPVNGGLRETRLTPYGKKKMDKLRGMKKHKIDSLVIMGTRFDYLIFREELGF